MSDFDEEAEREKLRERFAEDEKKRETTERMSELLLQGATMTDTHCENCGDPLFRYDGQTFCSTCQHAVAEGDSAAGTEPAEPTDERADTSEATTHDGTAASDGRRIAVDDTHTATDADGAAERERAGTPERAHAEPTPTHDRRAPPSQSDGSTGSRPDTEGDDLAETEASLARTLRRQATAAEGADDLGRAREHLAVAREAAEALAAVRQAGR